MSDKLKELQALIEAKKIESKNEAEEFQTLLKEAEELGIDTKKYVTKEPEPKKEEGKESAKKEDQSKEDSKISTEEKIATAIAEAFKKVTDGDKVEEKTKTPNLYA